MERLLDRIGRLGGFRSVAMRTFRRQHGVELLGTGLGDERDTPDRGDRCAGRGW
jgi:hypothetical protein